MLRLYYYYYYYYNHLYSASAVDRGTYNSKYHKNDIKNYTSIMVFKTVQGNCDLCTITVLNIVGLPENRK